MPPHMCQASKTHELNHALQGSNNTSLGDSTDASIFNQQGVERQPIAHMTPHQNNASGTPNTILSERAHRLTIPRKTRLFQL